MKKLNEIDELRDLLDQLEIQETAKFPNKELIEIIHKQIELSVEFLIN